MTLKDLGTELLARQIDARLQLIPTGWRLHVVDADGKQAKREISFADGLPDRLAEHIDDLVKALPAA